MRIHVHEDGYLVRKKYIQTVPIRHILPKGPGKNHLKIITQNLKIKFQFKTANLKEKLTFY